MPVQEYITLSEADKLQIVKDALRGKESDHYRASLVAGDNPGAVQRVADLEAEAETLRAALEEQEAAAAEEHRRNVEARENAPVPVISERG